MSAPAPLLALLALLAAPALRAEPKLTGAGLAINRNAVAGGGSRLSGAGFRLDGAVGQNAVSTCAGGGFAVAPGLMQLIAQPGSVTSIVAVSKATGSLELAWSSPGLDGFQGDVAAGFYRIDSSSDPLHVFDPTVFVAEFATNTAPGDPQRYTLTGLEPNTTYYSRIYLSDNRKVVSETSSRSDESSLARVPTAPAFSGVFATSVTISWTLPAGGAEGFRLDASSTGFIGGTVFSSSTPNGVTVTLTVTGLNPDTTYYFNLASLNWQSDVNFTSLLSTKTLPGGPLPILNLALTADHLNRRVTLTWVNPVFANPAGVTILVSTNPISAALADGTPYPPGTVLADGSVVKSSAAASSYVETSLELDVTGYFQLYSRDNSDAYSVAVATSLVLDLPPMAPAALRGLLSSGGTSYMLDWAGVVSNLDGAGFKLPPAPSAWELQRYDVYRATGIISANWVWIGSTSVPSPYFAAEVPVPGAVYYYRVVSRDAFLGGLSDAAMAIDTRGGLWAVHPDGITRFHVPSAASGVMYAAGNSYGRPLLLRASDRPQDLGGRVVKSVRFNPVLTPSNQPAALPAATAAYGVSLRYSTLGGVVVPSALGAPMEGGAISAANAPQALSAYYLGENDAAKLFGHVDPLAQEVSLQTGLLGGYQIRSVARPAAFDFDLGGVSNRAITPNGDGLNDTVVFTFNNPQDSAFNGKIYDLRGRHVSDMRPGPVTDSLLWDGKAGGGAVPRGVYLYQIQAEGRTFNGTVVVIR